MAEGFPARGVAIIDALLSKYLVLAQGSDEERRRLTGFIAQQMCFELGEKWGTKSADRYRPPSKDGLAHRNDDGTIDIWDWQNGTTRARQVQVGDAPTVANATQYFIAVERVNVLGVPVAPPPPPPPPPVDPNDELARVIDDAAARIVGGLTELTDMVELLNTRVGDVQRDGIRLRLR